MLHIVKSPELEQKPIDQYVLLKCATYENESQNWVVLTPLKSKINV